MKDFLRNHGLWILFAGAVIAGAAVFFTVSHLVRERNRETFELYNSTLASARLAALQVLRDEGLESGIALLENALLNAVFGDEENSPESVGVPAEPLPGRPTAADRARR